MVKAIKRGPAGSGKFGSREGRREPFKKRYAKFIILLALALITVGFTLNAPHFGSNSRSEGPPEEEQDFGIGTQVGTMAGNVTNVSDNLAVFGQMSMPRNLNQKLGGDLYYLGEGSSLVILTSATADKIRSEASGGYIIYNISSCGDFDCLVGEGGMPNGSSFFEVYDLDKPSNFLKTDRIGIPTAS